jgi:flagellar hook-associated protein 3 FlgL
MFRVKELTVQASNDTLSGADRQSIATELRGVREQILSMANSQDPSGNHLFSGSRVGQPPFAPPEDDPTGSPVYQGDRTRMKVLIGDQRTLPTNRAGPEVFARVVRTDADTDTPTGVGFFSSRWTTWSRPWPTPVKPTCSRGNKEVDDLLDGLVLAQADIGTDMSNIDQQTMTLEDLVSTPSK